MPRNDDHAHGRFCIDAEVGVVGNLPLWSLMVKWLEVVLYAFLNRVTLSNDELELEMWVPERQVVPSSSSLSSAVEFAFMAAAKCLSLGLKKVTNSLSVNQLRYQLRRYRTTAPWSRARQSRSTRRNAYCGIS